MFRLLAFVCCIHATFAQLVARAGLPRIIGGNTIRIEDAPYQVSIIHALSGIHKCGGSIVSADYVLTAGHCARLPAWEYKIRSGSSYFDRGGTLHTVTRHIRHEDFYIYKVGVPVHDIALMKVSPPFHLNGTTEKKLELFAMGEKANVGDEALLTGWGRSETERTARQLQSVRVKIIANQTCSDRYAETNGIRKNQICAMNANPRKGMCKGDSGGPLVIDNKQVGIVSWAGPGCPRFVRPGVYTEVAAYRDWIDKHIKA